MVNSILIRNIWINILVMNKVFIGVLFLFFFVNYLGNKLFLVIIKGNFLVSNV